MPPPAAATGSGSSLGAIVVHVRRMQIEWFMRRVLSGAAERRLATVADRNFRQTQVQCEVDYRGGAKAGIEVNRAVQRHENQTDQGKQNGNPQTDFSVEVSLNVKVGLFASGAHVDLVIV